MAKKKATSAKKKATSAKKKAKSADATKSKRLTARIQVNASEEISSIYANHAEVSHTKHEFLAIFARIPTKATPAQAAIIQETGVIQIDPEIQILIPPTLIPGLIRAFQVELEKFEAVHGTISSESGQ